MRKRISMAMAASALGLLLSVGAQAQQAAPAAAPAAKEPTGQELAHNVRKGNCLACHMMPGDPKAISSATIGPPLIAMKSRFPDRAKLKEQIADPMKNNPETSMPPYGKHGILTPKELDLVVDYIHGL